MRPRTFLYLLFAVAIAVPNIGWGKFTRDSSQRAAFTKHHPCPATGKSRSACPGYVVDHVKPLCAGGVDQWQNMQWQTVADAKLKDREEWAFCRSLRKR